MTQPASSDRGSIDESILGLTPAIRRVVFARVADPHSAEDLVQETLARIMEARARLDPEALGPYAIVTARNLVASLRRTELRHQRQAHRLVDLRPPERPDEESLRREERVAVAAALAKLSTRERAAVIAHEVEDVDTATMARALGSTPGGVATQLARARAKLRVDYLLALRRGEPPSAKCRPVLIALSAGDRRRQLALDAGNHLLECDFCAGFSEPLVHRSRALAGWLSIPLLGAAYKHVLAALKTPAGQIATATAGVGTVAVVLLTGQPAAAPPRPPCPGAQSARGEHLRGIAGLTARGQAVDPRSAAQRGRLAGTRIRARGSPVYGVPSDEGFWLGPCSADLVWVSLKGGSESGPSIDAGDNVSFTGHVVTHSAGFVQGKGITAEEGAARFRRAPQHIVARESTITVHHNRRPAR